MREELRGLYEEQRSGWLLWAHQNVTWKFGSITGQDSKSCTGMACRDTHGQIKKHK